MQFTDLGLSPRLAARLAAEGLERPTPIQAEAIPHALAGRDVLGIAQTGTGKTAAFGIPLVVALAGSGKRSPRGARGLILAPTRELARQIVESLRRLDPALAITLVVGGRSLHAQTQALARGTDILVATPGRLIDLMDRRAIDLGATRFLVLDEADQMLDIGFIHALRRIAPALSAERQTMLFSATMPKAMAELAGEYLHDPVRVEVSAPGRVADKVAHAVHFVPKDGKRALLGELLAGHAQERALVFARTKRGAERLMRDLVREGFEATSIHGNKSQGQRERAIAAFSSGRAKVLVATDVAARGIDIPGVEHVYNYDLPTLPENYVHRIGRTARAGRSGRALALCSAEEMGELRAIEALLGDRLEVAGGAPWAVAGKAAGRGRGRGSSRRRGSGRARRAA
ncbi:MAG: DEAD/DEAH box helicase [Alphaproteobacteria bacterium]|nr:MAG: DEAD/DEAH box helicase [Alphaproteobacteria bacterium]